MHRLRKKDRESGFDRGAVKDMAYITCKDLTLGYDGRPVAEGLNFSVSKGDYLCVVGENGSGKSTLVKTLLRLIPPVSGTVEYGEGITQKNIGYLSQQTLVQRDFPASVREIVTSGCLPFMRKPFYGREERRRAEANMERMGITGLAGKSYRDLSGGQQQRVLFARALCAADRMLLLDEPVSGLDPRVTAEMYAIVKELNGEGMSIVMISHDVSSAVKYASHILHVGYRPLFFGKTEDYLGTDVAKLFLRGNGDD